MHIKSLLSHNNNSYKSSNHIDFMLNEGQELIYFKLEDGELLEQSRIDPAFASQIPGNYVAYLRFYQPFTVKDNNFSFPVPGEGEPTITRTSQVQSTRQEGNKLYIETLNSTYVVEYSGIDLEKVLQDGLEEGLKMEEPFPEVVS